MSASTLEADTAMRAVGPEVLGGIDMNTKLTRDELYEAEEQIRHWHQQSTRQPAGTQMQPGIFSRFAARLRAAGQHMRTGRGRAATLSDGVISTLGVLDAVARGELSPKAAHRLLHARISTLALLQSVAWGEISPAAARHLLG